MSTTTATHSDNKLRNGALVGYIGGVEVPVVSGSVEFYTGGVATTDLVLAPSPLLNGLGVGDRVEVQLFYRDVDYYNGGNEKYCLLYDGVVRGQSFARSAYSNALSLSSVDHLQILDTLNPFYITGVEAAAARVASSPTGQEVDLSVPGLTMPWSILFNGLDGSAQIKRPYDFIENILKVSSSRKHVEELQSLVTAQFYARYFRRINFVRRFAPAPIIEINPMRVDKDANYAAFPMLKILRSTAVMSAIEKQMSGIGLNTTMLSSINGLFSTLLYNLGTIPAPSIAAVDDVGDIIGPPDWSAAGNVAPLDRAMEEVTQRMEIEGKTYSAEGLEAEVKALEAEFAADDRKSGKNAVKPPRLVQYLSMPDWVFGIAPTCNVLFPSMVNELHVTEDYLSQITRMYVNDHAVTDMVGQSSTMGNLAYGYPQQVQAELDKKYKTTNDKSYNPTVSGKNLLVWPEEFFKGPFTAQIDSPSWLVYTEQRLNNTMTKDELLAKEALELIERYVDSVDVGRYAHAQALEEVNEDTVGVSVSLEDKYDMIREREAELRKSVLKKKSTRANLLLARFKSLGLIDASITSLNEAVTKLQRRASVHKFKRDRLQRVMAQYEFIKRRASTRSAVVSSGFNPYIVPGFTAVVFDNDTTGHHIVGFVESVSHSFNSENISTTVKLSYVLTLDEAMQYIFDARVGNTPDGVLSNIGAAPVVPLTEVRAISQYLDAAEEFFAKAFHQNMQYNNANKRAAFDLLAAINFVVGGRRYTFDDVFEERVKQEQERRQQQAAADEAAVAAETKVRVAELKEQYNATVKPLSSVVGVPGETIDTTAQALAEITADIELMEEERAYKNKVKRLIHKPIEQVTSNILTSYTSIVPAKPFSGIFNNFDDAMRFVSRPVCTLEDYIRFRGDWGNTAVLGKYTPSNYLPVQLLIFKSANVTPVFDQNNFIVEPGLGELPDMRVDWVTRLLRYRATIKAFDLHAGGV